MTNRTSSRRLSPAEQRLNDLGHGPTMRRRLLRAASEASRPDDQAATCEALMEAEMARNRELRALLCHVEQAARKLDRELARFERKYVNHGGPIRPLEQIGSHLGAILAACSDGRITAPSPRLGNKRDDHKRRLAYAIADVFYQADLDVNSNPDGLFGQTVKALASPAGSTSVLRWIRPFAKTQG